MVDRGACYARTCFLAIIPNANPIIELQLLIIGRNYVEAQRCIVGHIDSSALQYNEGNSSVNFSEV